LEEITEKFMEKILDMVDQNVKDAHKIKNMRRHRNN
jgi:hypothetical protein